MAPLAAHLIRADHDERTGDRDGTFGDCGEDAQRCGLSGGGRDQSEKQFLGPDPGRCDDQPQAKL